MRHPSNCILDTTLTVLTSVTLTLLVPLPLTLLVTLTLTLLVTVALALTVTVQFNLHLAVEHPLVISQALLPAVHTQYTNVLAALLCRPPSTCQHRLP